MSLEKSFCILPFNHLATHPDGKVTPCCESKEYFAKTKGKVLELGKATINDIRRSDSFNTLRQDMLEGKLHQACNFCYEREKAGLISKRYRENQKYNVDYSDIEVYKQLPLQSIELRLGNVCNAKCVICHPKSSSKWNEDITNELIKVDRSYHKNIITNTWFRSNVFYQEILDHAPLIRHLWFNGGEPLLIKEHLKFLKQLVDLNVTTNIELEYHTNGSLITEEIIKLWNKFKFTKITLSLDDIDERFNYSRFPLTFDQVKNGIELLKENNIYYDIIPTINLLNVYNITNIYEYFNSRYAKECKFNYLRVPKFQSIVNLPEKIKKEILENSRLPKNLYEELKYELYSVEGQGLTKAVNFYRTLDRQRGVSLEEYLPEWNQYF